MQASRKADSTGVGKVVARFEMNTALTTMKGGVVMVNWSKSKFTGGINDAYNKI